MVFTCSGNLCTNFGGKGVQGTLVWVRYLEFLCLEKVAEVQDHRVPTPRLEASCTTNAKNEAIPKRVVVSRLLSQGLPSDLEPYEP